MYKLDKIKVFIHFQIEKRREKQIKTNELLIAQVTDMTKRVNLKTTIETGFFKNLIKYKTIKRRIENYLNP